MRWQLQSNQQLKFLNQIEKILLENRGVEDKKFFFNPPHPLQLDLKTLKISNKEITKAKRRIKKAQENQETIVIFGDYDADGITGTAVLQKALERFGCKVVSFLPDRKSHGYGLSQKALESLFTTYQPSLIITVDNGIVAFGAAEYLAKQQIDLIITDHHLPEEQLPESLAIIHTTDLTGAGVAWVLARELLVSDQHFLKTLLDLVAIGTVADQAPLLGANRSFVFHGLKELGKTSNRGLQALLKEAQVSKTHPTTKTINFVLAPRINATGRLKHGQKALDLLLATDLEQAKKLAKLVSLVNSQRQQLTRDWFFKAISRAQDDHQKLLIVHDDEYHEGVIGLIAGRLTEKFYKPAIVMTSGQKTIKASARSIPGVNIIDLIRQIKDHLIDAGGHPMAAGFSFEKEKQIKVVSSLLELAKDHIFDHQLEPILPVEAVLPFSLINFKLVSLLNKFEPFGKGNHEPIFGLTNLKVLSVFTMGQDNQHLKLVVTDNLAQGATQAKTLYCLAWNKGSLAADLRPGQIIKVAGTLQVNEWKGRKSLQIIISDLLTA